MDRTNNLTNLVVEKKELFYSTAPVIKMKNCFLDVARKQLCHFITESTAITSEATDMKSYNAEGIA